jgi:hypothetical protein
MTRRIPVFPELTLYNGDKLLEESPTPATSEGNLQRTSTLSPEERFPDLYVLLRHRGLEFKEAFSRQEALRLFGINERTLTRWIEQQFIYDFGLPDVFASAQDIEDCLRKRRERQKRPRSKRGDYVS